MLTSCSSFLYFPLMNESDTNRISWQLVVCPNICDHFLLLQKRKCQYTLLQKDKLCRGSVGGGGGRWGWEKWWPESARAAGLEWVILGASWLTDVDRMMPTSNQQLPEVLLLSCTRLFVISGLLFPLLIISTTLYWESKGRSGSVLDLGIAAVSQTDEVYVQATQGVAFVMEAWDCNPRCPNLKP